MPDIRYNLPPPPPAGEVYVVLVPCEGDKRTTSIGSFASLTLPTDHPVFTLEPTPLSVATGFPLVIAKTGTPKSDITNRQLLENQPATFLNIDAESGFAPPHWQDYVGTVVVARKDGKSLDSRHYEIVWQYADRMLGLWSEYESGRALRAEGHLCKEDLEAYSESYVEGMRMNGRGSSGIGRRTGCACPPCSDACHRELVYITSGKWHKWKEAQAPRLLAD